jgi:hypothetical protein
MKKGFNMTDKKPIDSLTPEQEAKFPEYVEKWTKIGLNCDPCDFEAAKAAALKCYASAGVEAPKYFHHTRSPAECAQLQHDLKIKYGVYQKDQKFNLSTELSDQIYGSHDASWLSFYDFFIIECGESIPEIEGLIELSKVCGWWAPYSENVIFQDRHEFIHLDDQDRLHNESGPAVQYRDGFKIWAIEGHKVDEQLVMAPETQTIEQIDGESNGDIRAIRIERFGWPNYLAATNSLVVDRRDNDIEGTKEALYKSPRGDMRLVVSCPTGRVFCLGVPTEITSCEAAQKWFWPSQDVRIIGRT